MVAQKLSLDQRGYEPGNPPVGLIDRIWMRGLMTWKRHEYDQSDPVQVELMHQDISACVARQIKG